MMKKCTRILFTILCIITILMSMILPSGALSYEHYYEAVNLSTAILVDERLSLYTPFEFVVFGETRESVEPSGYEFNNIYRFDVNHLMDPSQFRYSDGIQVMFRGREVSGALTNAYAYFDLKSASYTAPSIRNPGTQYLTYTGRMENVNDNTLTASYLMLKGTGYSLATSRMSSSVNGVSTLQLSDVDVSRCRVQYDYSIFGLDSLKRDVNSIIVDVPFASNVASVPVLPLSVLSDYWGEEDCYVDYCNVTIEMQNSSYATAEYEGSYKFLLYGGEVYDAFSNVDSLSKIFSNVDYQTGFNNGYNAGKRVASQESYDEGFSNGKIAGKQEGYQQGVDDTWEDLDFTSWIGVAIGGFMDTQLFGNFTIGGMLAVVVSLTLVLTFLKFFAGG